MQWPAYVIPLVVGVAGTGGVLWAALSWRRDDTGKVVAQTAEIVTMLRGVIDELEKALDRAEAVGHATRAELEKARAECKHLRDELDDAYRQLSALRNGEPHAD